MKKIPIRRCISCMESKPKKDLFRIVKNNNGEICFDQTGKKQGRGAYICSLNCLNNAIKCKKLSKQLEMDVSVEIYEQLVNEITTYIK